MSIGKSAKDDLKMKTLEGNSSQLMFETARIFVGWLISMTKHGKKDQSLCWDRVDEVYLFRQPIGSVITVTLIDGADPELRLGSTKDRRWSMYGSEVKELLDEVKKSLGVEDVEFDPNLRMQIHQPDMSSFEFFSLLAKIMKQT